LTISALNKAALESEHSRRIYFLFLDILPDPLYACSGTRNFNTLGEDWLGIGEIQGISDAAEAADLAARPLTVALSGVDSFIVEPFASRTNYKNRKAALYRGLLDASGELVDAPYPLWRGRMDVANITKGESNFVALTCEPLAARLLRPNISRYSDQDHQTRWPGDKYYEFLPQMEKKDVVWGGQRVSPGGLRGPVSPPPGTIER
jgi:hypothetical protein